MRTGGKSSVMVISVPSTRHSSRQKGGTVGRRGGRRKEAGEREQEAEEG